MCVRLSPLQQLLECNKCRNSYHPECLGPNYPTRPTKKKKVWASSPRFTSLSPLAVLYYGNIDHVILAIWDDHGSAFRTQKGILSETQDKPDGTSIFRDPKIV